jgi:hypothetical protein
MNDTATQEQPDNKENPLVTEALKQGAVPEGYKEIDIEFFQFKTPGDKIEGRLLAKNNIQVKGVRVGKYTIQNLKDNKKYAFLGSVQLDELMANISIGTQIMVVYIDEILLENLNKMKHFKVYAKTI